MPLQNKNAENSLIPIYELVEDPAKRAALKSAVENYIANSITVYPVVPLYYMKNTKTDNSFYTTNKNELGNGNGDWKIENAGMPVCYIFNEQVPNSVPFYRFYKEVKRFFAPSYHNYFYTRIYNAGIEHDYTLKKIEGYVYASDFNNSVGWYQYRNDAKRDHFYSLFYNRPPTGYSYNCPAGYVYPADWYYDFKDFD